MIDFNQYTCAYDDRQVLKNINLHIDKGARVGLIGLNGSGKTTLMKSIVGIVKPSSGSLRVADIEVKKKTLKAVRQKVGYIFQDADDQLFMPTVYEDIAFGLKGLSPEAIEQKVMAQIAFFNLEALKDRPPFLLSGGEKKRVSIAGIMVMNPDLILLDEPTEGLDVRSKKKVIEMIKAMDQTLLICSHDYELIKVLCDEVVVLEEGQVIYQGPLDDFFNNEGFLLAHELI